MVAFAALKAGDVVYDVRRRKMGNTTMSEDACWEVRIVSTDGETQTVTASWNGNPAKRYGRRDIQRWRRSRPNSKPTKGNSHEG